MSSAAGKSRANNAAPPATVPHGSLGAGYGSLAVSRREFLVRAAALAGAVAATPQTLVRAAEPTGDAGRPRVVQVHAERVQTAARVDEALLFDLVEVILQRLTGQADLAAAWQTLLTPGDRVALKFTRTAADQLETVPPMLRVLVRSLERAGIGPERIMAVDVHPAVVAKVGVQPAPWGWTEEEHDFGSGRDRLAVWLESATAIINIPFLTTDNLGGMACCLRNLSYSLLKHPAQFYSASGSPHVANIVAMPVIRSKLRLNLVNALRLVFDGGPEAQEDFTLDAGLVLGGVDPVAVDTVALHRLNRLRGKLGLERIGNANTSLDYLEEAEACGLGTSKPYQIYTDKIEWQ